MNFADLIEPFSRHQFLSEYHGRQPVHLPAEGRRSDRPLDWERMNGLLSILPHWTEENLKLILNSRPIDPSFYMTEVETLSGRVRRADPAKVRLFLDMGVNLVANAVDDICPDIRKIAEQLGDEFGAKASANIYCSFKGVQAFASHCDPHEVFVLQCEGEKIWNIYENRSSHPRASLTQSEIDARKGAILLNPTLRPGDVLYIPRGYYHDALAATQDSLHLTFSVWPIDGRAVLELVQQLGSEDELFQEYLPDARENAEALALHLERLSQRVHSLLQRREVVQQLSERQRASWTRRLDFTLPKRRTLDFFAVTGKPAEIVPTDQGDRLRGGMVEVELGALGQPAQWLLQREAFSLQELMANFITAKPQDLSDLVLRLERHGFIRGYVPQM